MDAGKLLIWLAVPVFLLGIGLELWVMRRRRLGGYAWGDSIASMATGLTYQVLNIPFAIVELAALVRVHDQVSWRLTGWVAWLVGIIAVDLLYYAYHRTHHEIRLLWAVHVVHHSSQQYNLATALRQPWVVVTILPFFLPIALLGVDGKIIMASYSINLLYQFWIHTEQIDKLWAPIEFVFNTPSHHRVHHGSNPQYLDRNYGGILIVWDRAFGSFEPEGERVAYGLTKNIKTNNFLRIETHEFVSIWRDVRAAGDWRTRLNRVFRGPGWEPAVALRPVPVQAA